MSTAQIVKLALPDRSGARAAIQIRIRRETVEIWCRDRVVAVEDRDRLRDWLARPVDYLDRDEVRWVWNGIRVLIYIRGQVPAFPLPGHVIAGLRRRLAADQHQPR